MLRGRADTEGDPGLRPVRRRGADPPGMPADPGRGAARRGKAAEARRGGRERLLEGAHREQGPRHRPRPEGAPGRGERRRPVHPAESFSLPRFPVPDAVGPEQPPQRPVGAS